MNFSLGSPLILLNYVLSSMSVYFISFLKPPSGIISSFYYIFSTFFLGGCENSRKMSWIK